MVKWLIPLIFLVLSLYFYNTVHGHSFLGLVCLCAAGVIACYYLLDLAAIRFPQAARLLQYIVTGALCIGVLVFAVTEAVIIRASRRKPETPCDHVIVLGARIRGTEPSLSLADRIRTTEEYLKENPHTVAVLSGGQGADEGIPEALCMYRELTARGIGGDRLLLEEKSTSTWENFQFSRDLIREKTGTAPKKIGVVSSEYHMFRAGLFARRWGMEMVGIPAETSVFSIRLNYFMREAAGVWHYLILGGKYHD